MKRVLVAGGSGLLGAPVVRELLTSGYDVRLLSRNPAKTNETLGALARSVQVLAGTVTDLDSVDRAVRGCSHVHISLNGGSDPAELEAVEHRGTALVAAAAAQSGVELLSYVSGMLVHRDYGAKIPEHAAKLGAERAIRASGVPFVLLRPTYVMETLTRHVQGRLAVAIGRPPPLHMVAAADLARMVVRAYGRPDVGGRDLHIRGPEPVTIAAALRTYCALAAPRSRVVVIPTRALSNVDRLLLHGRLRPALDVITLLERCGEHGDPTEADQLLGAPTTTVEEWTRRVAEARAL
jgi:uncharacterized protein YbjT (DUF2867 family)